ncbi:MAG: DUF1002 domain-containing protein [Eubacteriales bacterium]|nr:DUF1002 domain-containing protein [Eubacteriales bacterium]
MKKTISLILAALFGVCLIMPAAMAATIAPGEQRITMGADLSDAQRASIYEFFGVERGTIKELTVTNSEERSYLEGLIPDERLGRVALSCVYITVLDAGSGIKVETNNINWCTEQMYINAMITAGITDASVKVSAPYPLSGTAALTGIYKAYEDITGEKLDEDAKAAAAEELITTGELAEFIGSEEATRLINELKKILNNIKSMTDDEVRAEIRRIAAQCNISVTDSQVEQLLTLCRTLQNLDVENLQSRLLGWLDTVDKLSSVSSWFAKIWRSVLEFLTSIFGGFFGKGK